ncbi:hypothetical protein [Burkholderia sp. 3C]
MSYFDTLPVDAAEFSIEKAASLALQQLVLAKQLSDKVLLTHDSQTVATVAQIIAINYQTLSRT